MGYSISAKFPSEELRDEVLAFLDKNFRDWVTLLGLSDEVEYVRGPTDDVSYGLDNIPLIGFDFSTTNTAVQYAYRICTWMAVLISQLKNCDACALRLDCLTRPDCPLECINYDGCEDIPLEEFKELDEIGFYPLTKRNIFLRWLEDKDLPKFNKLVKNELQRLTDLWRQEDESEIT